MQFFFLALAGIGGLFLLFKPNLVSAAQSNASVLPYEDVFRKWARYYGIDWRLLAAHAKVESDFRANAVNPRDNESIGLMQILCVPDGKGGCSNPLNLPEWKNITREKLFDVDLNVSIAAGILEENITRKGWPRGSAMYNNYSARNSKLNGPFPNQRYVDKVTKYFDLYKEQYSR